MADIEQEGVSPATAGGAPAGGKWRAGNRNPRNLYYVHTDGREEHRGVMFTPVDGQGAVAALNLALKYFGQPDPRLAEIERLHGLAEQRDKLLAAMDQIADKVGGRPAEPLTIAQAVDALLDQKRRAAAEVDQLRTALTNYQDRLRADLARGGELVERIRAARGVNTSGTCTQADIRTVGEQVNLLCAERDKMSDDWAARQQLVRERDQALAEAEELETQWDHLNEELAAIHEALGPLHGDRSKGDTDAEVIAALRRERRDFELLLDQIADLAGGTIDRPVSIRDAVMAMLREATEVRAERDRLGAELAAAAKQLARVGLQVATIQVITGDIGKELKATTPPAEPRRWVAGDPEPEIGTTVSTNLHTYTRAADGDWYQDSNLSGPYTWKHLTYYTPVVEVVSAGE